MKKILIIALVFISTLSFGQTKLDSVLFDKINEYRVSKKVSPLKWNISIYKAAEHHTKYIEITGHFSHYEDSIVTGFNSLLTHHDRLRFYMDSDNYTTCENIARNPSIKSIKSKDDVDYELIAITILKQWINSPGHNKNLLNKNSEIGAVYISIFYTPQNIGNYVLIGATSTYMGVRKLR